MQNGMYVMDDDDVRDLLRQACEAAGSQRAFALEHGINIGLLSSIYNGHRRPVPQVLEALGLRVVKGYQRSGELDERDRL